MEPTPPPPQSSGYYRPPTNSPLSPYRPPGVYFDSLSTAITAIQENWGMWLGCSFTYIVVSIPLIIVALMIQGHGSLLYAGPFDLNAWMQGEAVTIFNSFITSTLLAGMVRMGVKVGYGEKPEFKDLFSAMPNIWTIALMSIVLGIVLGLGYLLLIVPGIFLTGALGLTLPIITEQKVGAIEAMKRSYEALKGDAWTMFVLLLVASVCSSVGYLACGIGFLLTMPVFPIILGLHYTYFFPKDRMPQTTVYQFLEPPR